MQQKTLQRGLGHNIMAFDKYFRIYLKNGLKDHNLNAAEGMVLLSLIEKGNKTEGEIFTTIHTRDPEITQDQLVHELHYDKSVMTRTMQSLEGKGYVVRAVNPTDSRSFVFSLTKKGAVFKEVLLTNMMEWNAAVLDGFSLSEIDLMNDMLARLAQNAKVAGSRER
ncbi:MarR family winged helix-turn-helix transcriptional regulator [uncultured Methanocorpusculum sp.]|nr:MarR family transcriptional regulator [uncultured Methanocorpusculum sp.]